ncbi:uncharacterized protein V6R79_023879 [Siganus canaliculatus]
MEAKRVETISARVDAAAADSAPDYLVTAREVIVSISGHLQKTIEATAASEKNVSKERSYFKMRKNTDPDSDY